MVVLPFVPGDRRHFQFARRDIRKTPRARSASAPRVFSTTRQVARGMFFLPFRHDHRCAFFDRLLDELVAIAFFAAQCDEETVPLHSPRVIRDAFHFAIKWADDLAWRRSQRREF